MQITFRCDPALLNLLPQPVPAQSALPQWLRQMAARAPSEVHQRSVRTIKQCPPFVDAMAHGFILSLPCDVVVASGQFSWDWSLPELAAHHHPRAPVSFHVPEQLTGSPQANGASSAIKFNSFWTITLEPGWSLMVVHPINRDDLPFRVVTGLVDADSFNAVGINFPAVWIDPRFEGVLPRGTPVAQCYPVPQQAPVLVVEPMSAEHVTQYDAVAAQVMASPGVYRKGYRHRRTV